LTPQIVATASKLMSATRIELAGDEEGTFAIELRT